MRIFSLARTSLDRKEVRRLIAAMILASALDEQLLRNLAWAFTVLSAVVSIGLSIHRFGLSPAKRIMAIVGVLLLGVAAAVLFISDLSPFNSFDFITKDQAEQIKTAHGKDGNRSTGYEITKDGVTEKSASDEVNRVSEYIYAVIHPNGNITAVYNGGFFEAEVKGRKITCELIDVGDGRVLVISGDNLETVKLGSDQAENTFKIQKVPVQNP